MQQLRRILLCGLSWFSFLCLLQAQPQSPQWSLAFQQGSILQINPRYPDQLRPARFAELGLSFPTQGNKVWQERYGFPTVKWRLLAGDLGRKNCQPGLLVFLLNLLAPFSACV
ncbi:MAG: hypothetical protein AAF399_05985 [Bacteroidota bacterium]